MLFYFHGTYINVAARSPVADGVLLPRSIKLIKPAAVDSFGSGLDKKIDMLYSGLRPLLRTLIEYQKFFKGTLKAVLRPGYGLRRRLNDSLCKVADERMESILKSI